MHIYLNTTIWKLLGSDWPNVYTYRRFALERLMESSQDMQMTLYKSDIMVDIFFVIVRSFNRNLLLGENSLWEIVSKSQLSKPSLTFSLSLRYFYEILLITFRRFSFLFRHSKLLYNENSCVEELCIYVDYSKILLWSHSLLMLN